MFCFFRRLRVNHSDPKQTVRDGPMQKKKPDEQSSRLIKSKVWYSFLPSSPCGQPVLTLPLCRCKCTCHTSTVYPPPSSLRRFLSFVATTDRSQRIPSQCARSKYNVSFKQFLLFLMRCLALTRNVVSPIDATLFARVLPVDKRRV